MYNPPQINDNANTIGTQGNVNAPPNQQSDRLRFMQMNSQFFQQGKKSNGTKFNAEFQFSENERNLVIC